MESRFFVEKFWRWLQWQSWNLYGGEIELTGDLRWVAGTKGPHRRVRMIGINCAPNTYVWITHELGRVASEFTEAELKDRKFWLEYDVSGTDRFGRDLAYVWVSSPDVMIGETLQGRLLLRGLAVTARTPPDVRYSRFFSSFERQARDERAGIWGFE